MVTPKKIFILLTSMMLLSFSLNASSATFWRTGKVTRVLTDSTHFGGCMVNISATIANGCPNNGWVSLDCDGKHSDPGEGQRAYASVLVALTLGKQISLYVDNTKKNSGYCVARRLDIVP